MKFIKNCRSCRHGEYGNVKCEHCTHSSTNPPSNWEPIPNQTHGDRIRAMSDEELADFLCSISTAECCDRSCPARDMCDYGDMGLIKWLKQPAKEEECE